MTEGRPGQRWRRLAVDWICEWRRWKRGGGSRRSRRWCFQAISWQSTSDEGELEAEWSSKGRWRTEVRLMTNSTPMEVVRLWWGVGKESGRGGGCNRGTVSLVVAESGGDGRGNPKWVWVCWGVKEDEQGFFSLSVIEENWRTVNFFFENLWKFVEFGFENFVGKNKNFDSDTKNDVESNTKLGDLGMITDLNLDLGFTTSWIN